MRRGAEEEAWDRLAFQLANIAAIAGAKNVKIENFHKFKEPDTRLTAAKIRSMKGLFTDGKIRIKGIQPEHEG